MPNYAFNLKHHDLLDDMESPERWQVELYKNKVLMTGNASLVEKLYKYDYAKIATNVYDYQGIKNTFWHNVQPDNARVMFGLVKMINDAFVRIVTMSGFEAKVKVKGKTYTDVEFDRKETDRLNEILDFNDFKTKKWGMAESWQSGLGYAPIKISMDESLSEYPIVEVIKPEKTEVMEKRGVTLGYKFKTRKEVLDREYELQEIYRFDDLDQPVIEYRLLKVGKQEPEEVDIQKMFEKERKVFHDLDLDFLIVDGELETVCYDFAQMNELPVILKNNTAYNSAFPTSPFGEPDTTGMDAIEDSLSEVFSSLVEEIRKGRIKVMISEDLIPTNGDGIKGKFNNFKLDYEVMNTDAAKQESKIEIVQGKINSEKYLAGISALIAYGCNKANIHPISVGITGVESIDSSQESQVEREKVTLRTREMKLKSWRKAFKDLFSRMLQTHDIMQNRKPQEYEIAIEFGEYESPSPQNLVTMLSEGITGGLFSTREAQASYYQENKNEDELEEIYIRTLIEKGVPLTDAQRAWYEERTQETLDMSDEDIQEETEVEGVVE